MNEPADLSKRRAVLSLWLSFYGEEHPLTPQDEQSFLGHESLTSILKFRPADVQECLQKHQKLVDVETCLMSQGYVMWNWNVPTEPPEGVDGYLRKRRGAKGGGSSPARTHKAVNLPDYEANQSTKKVTKKSRAKGSEKGPRSSRSGSSHLVYQPPVTSREDAQRATPAFDQFNRPDYS